MNIRIFHAIIVILLMLVSTTVAQGTWTTYTEEDGLINNRILSIAVDNNNVKWFGDWFSGGVSSFDGTTWTTYTQELSYLEDQYGIGVASITVDKDNVKWFARQGVVSYDGVEWKSYPEERITGVATLWRSAVDHNNVKWFCKGWEVISFDGNEWKSYQADRIDEFWGIGIDSSNVVWLLATVDPTADPGFPQLCKFDGAEIILMPMDRTIINTAGAQSIAIDNDDVIWIGTWHGFFCYDGERWRSYQESPFAGRFITSIAVDDNNVKWFAGYFGVASYDGITWNHYTSADGLADDSVLKVAIDNNGVKWFGTDNGVSSYDDRPVSVKTDAKPDQIAIIGNYPNPFNPTTTIAYTLDSPRDVTLEIYDIIGRKVKTLVSDYRDAGHHTAVFDGTGMASGVYFCRLRADSFSATGSMLLMK